MKTKLMGTLVSAVLAVSASTALAGPLEDRIAAGEPIRLGFASAAPWAHPGDDGEPLGFVNQTCGILGELLCAQGQSHPCARTGEIYRGLPCGSSESSQYAFVKGVSIHVKARPFCA